MYMKQGQILQIREAVKEIKKIATMKNCTLDNETKKKIKLWVMWFDIYANKINDALDNNLDEKYL